PLWKKVSPDAPFAPLLAFQHALVGRAHGLPRNALGVCIMLNCTLNPLLMHHVSLGVIRKVTKSPPELFGLNQKHVCRCPSVISRIPDAAVTVFLEFVLAKLIAPCMNRSLRVGRSHFRPWRLTSSSPSRGHTRTRRSEFLHADRRWLGAV